MRNGVAVWRFNLLMFPSSGLFAAVECPFSNNGLCDRPHCLYKHTTSMVGFAGKPVMLSHFRCEIPG